MLVKFLDTKNLTIKLQAYKAVILSVAVLIFKMEWIPKELKGMETIPKEFKGTPFRWLCGLGFQWLPKHFGFKRVKPFKRFQLSFWLVGMWIDFPRKYEIKDKDNLWCRI